MQQVRGPRGTATALPCVALLLELSHDLTLEQIPSKQIFPECLVDAMHLCKPPKQVFGRVPLDSVKNYPGHRVRHSAFRELN